MNERYIICRHPETKDWYIYDDKLDRNICYCDTQDECEQVAIKISNEPEHIQDGNVLDLLYSINNK